VAFDRLAADNLAALLLLSLAAWLAPEPIPLTVFTQYPDRLPDPLPGIVGDPLAVAAVTGLLQRRGLAQVTPQTIRLHRVPAALLRDRDTAGRGAGTGLADMARVLAAAVPDELDELEIWRLLIPHALAVVEHASDDPDEEHADDIAYLLEKAASYLLVWHQQFRAALPLWKRVHEHHLSRDGLDDPKTLEAVSMVATCLHGLGDYQQARALDEDTLARRRRVLGDEASLGSAYNLARDLYALADAEGARTLCEDALARYRRTLGEDHEETLAMTLRLAGVLYAVGEYEQARTLAEDTLARSRRVFGEDHPNTRQIAENLAELLWRLGDAPQQPGQIAESVAEVLSRFGEAPE
jgi:tetratricopeptide (TPR) repeat protein